MHDSLTGVSQTMPPQPHLPQKSENSFRVDPNAVQTQISASPIQHQTANLRTILKERNR